LTYKDEEDDQITVSNNEDFLTALELNAGKNNISITVNLLGNLKVEEVLARCQPCAISSEEQKNSGPKRHSGGKGGHHHGHGHKHSHQKSSGSSEEDHCRRRKFHQMQEFMNEKIASQVDERVKVLIPCIRAQLQASPVKLFSAANPIVHENT
jgi:ABC-type Zn2+ transport system substrate-binding protein/surface adhesin